MDKEKLAEQYAEEQNSAYTNDYYGFLAGYEAGESKWINAETPPDDDREVLIYVRNLEIPHWSKNELGSFIEDKWYFRRGAPQEKYQVVKWTEIASNDEIKTLEGWNQIFGREIKTEEKEMTERQYTIEVFKQEQ